MGEAIHTVGAYAYHFWMQDMTPIRRGSGKQYVQRKSEIHRAHVRRKLAAYERHCPVINDKQRQPLVGLIKPVAR